MVEVNTFVLDNGIEYTEVDKLVYNDVKYLLLSNIKNVKDSCIRKILVQDNEEYITRLDDDAEFDIILDLFIKQNKALFS